MKIQSFVGALVVLFMTSLQAGVVPGRWEKLDAQAPTTQLTVVLRSGERITCFFKASDAETLSVADPVHGERRIRKSEVTRVETSADVRDSVVNGTLLGFGIGAGGYLGVHAAIVPLAEHDAPAAIVFGGIGALVGFLVDKTTENPEVLYISK